MNIIIVSTFLLGCDFALSEGVRESLPRVVTSLGTIEGHYQTSRNGRRYNAYEGIPYAQPPIGELRFEVPRPISPWTGVLMAKQPAEKCLQYTLYPCNPAHRVEGTEDCLYLNVYTTGAHRDDSNGSSRDENVASNTNLQPVIFFIYGGAFLYGDTIIYGPKYLLDKNVTLVNFNYRVGPLGFLSTEDDTVPGNMGLKDQVIALRWVKDNIRAFGGDPSRITIIGHSSGAACIHYHYLTNLTAGLFQRGMSLSGTALNSWALVENPLYHTKKLAGILGCSTDNNRGIVDCLKTRPGHQIVGAVSEFVVWLNSDASFGPVIEKGGGEFAFIDQSPIEIITSGKVQDIPWITGVVSEEGLAPAVHIITNETLLGEIDTDWETIAPNLLNFKYTVPDIDHPKVAGLIKKHYFGTSPIDRSTITQTVQMISDRLFVYDIQKAATLQARANQSPVRFYYFSYRGTFSFTKYMTGSSEKFGVCHGDDFIYVMESHLDPTTTPEDRGMMETLINLWVSYATVGTPDVGVDWPRVSRAAGEFRYVHIAGPDDISVKETTPAIFGHKNFWPTIEIHETITYNNRTIM